MSRNISRVACGIVVAVGVAASATSCTNNPAPLLILGILAPPTPSGSGATLCCTYWADIKGPFLSSSTVDFAFTRQYAPVLLVGNEVVPRGPAPRIDIERGVIVEGAIVRITDADGSQLDNYTIAGAEFLPPPIAGEPGLEAYETTLVSSAVADKLGTFSGTKRLVSYVIVFGRMWDGTHVESNEETFAISACVGCLVAFPPIADDPASATQPNCDASSSSAAITQPCVLGQDQPIDCRLCASTNAPFPPSNTNVCEP